MLEQLLMGADEPLLPRVEDDKPEKVDGGLKPEGSSRRLLKSGPQPKEPESKSGLTPRDTHGIASRDGTDKTRARNFTSFSPNPLPKNFHQLSSDE